MEYIIWCVGGGLLGAALGVLGFYYSKLAYSAFVTSLGAIGFVANMFLSVPQTSIGDDTGSLMIMGVFRKFTQAIEVMGLLPVPVQTGILVLIVSFFAARVATWWYQRAKPKAADETLADRRKRVLASYGMTSMDDVRSLR